MATTAGTDETHKSVVRKADLLRVIFETKNVEDNLKRVFGIAVHQRWPNDEVIDVHEMVSFFNMGKRVWGASPPFKIICDRIFDKTVLPPVEVTT